MQLPLSDGAVEIPVPEKFKNLIPKNCCAEASKLEDGRIQISIIKMRSVSCRFDEGDMLLSDEQLQDRILNPMINNLNRN